jgi:hypothetical protein
MKMQLTVEVGSLAELDRLMKRLIPLDTPMVIDEVAEYPAGVPTDIDEVPRIVGKMPELAAPYAQGEKVTAAQLEEALKAFSAAKGFDKARALLDEYVPGGRLGQVPEDQWSSLYARLTA